VTTVLGDLATGRDARPGDARRSATDRWAPAALVVLVVVAFVPYLLQRPGFVLDDWFTLRNAHFDGVLGAAGPEQRVARPGAWLVYAVVFGWIGQRALAVLALLAVIEAVTAVLLFRLVGRYFGPGLAVAAAALWVVLPNHTSTEAWASATNISLAALLVVGGLLLVGDRRGAARPVLGLLLLAASVLCYEATLPVAAAGIVAVRACGRGSLDRVFTAAGAVALGLPALWIVSHWNPGKRVASATTDLAQALPAHTGWGIVPDGPWSTITLVAAAAGITAVLAGAGRGLDPRHWSPATTAVLTGVVVIGVATLPFIRYAYQPLGAGDRVNFLSSMGGALLWAGLLATLARHRVLVTGAVVLLVSLSASVRWERAGVWHRAGTDATAIIAGVQARIPEPTGDIVAGPRPVVEGNVAAFFDESHIEAALELAYDDRDVGARMGVSQADFDAVAPDLRFDLRTVSRLDPGPG
jgi:hypothetical protein